MKSDMKSLLRAVVLLGAAIAGQAATMLTLTPSGSVSGTAGSTVGWGFSLVNTTNFLVVTSANFCLNPLNPPACTTAPSSVGVFNDFISTQPNAVIVGPAPESTTVSQAFSVTNHTGIGSFVFAPGALPGTLSGSILLTYDLFSLSPNDPNFDPGTDLISTDNFLSATASASVVIPEPSTSGLAAAGLALFSIVSRRRRRT